MKTEIRFNLFVQQKYIRKYFIVDNLELERIGEEGFFSFFQSLYRYIYICVWLRLMMNNFSINTLFLQTYREAIRENKQSRFHSPSSLFLEELFAPLRLVFLNRPIHRFHRPSSHFLSPEKRVRVSLAYAKASLKPNTRRTVSRCRRWNTGNGGNGYNGERARLPSGRKLGEPANDRRLTRCTRLRLIYGLDRLAIRLNIGLVVENIW